MGYNEAGAISEFLDCVTFAPFRKEIIVVDDGSTDGARQIWTHKNKAIKICYHDRNYGKGRDPSIRNFYCDRGCHRGAGCGYTRFRSVIMGGPMKKVRK